MKEALRLLKALLLKAALAFLCLSVALVLLFKWIDPPLTSIMAQNYLHTWFNNGQKASVKYAWVDYSAISPNLALAVIAAEDQKFPYHHGFDLEAISAAYRHNQTGKRLRGASTISQQVAKNLFLWNGRSYVRKGLEAYFTFLIELLWSKQRILEMYVNIAQMGNNIFGAGAASQVFFKVSAKQLTPRNGAQLASVLPSPSSLNVTHPSAVLLQRQQWILYQMTALGGPRYLQSI